MRIVILDGLQSRPGAFQPVGFVRLIAFCQSELFLTVLDVFCDRRIRFLARDDTLVDEFFGIDRAGRRMRSDLPIHDGLGEGRLVTLVVSVAPVTKQIDDHVLREGLAILHREFGCRYNSLWIVAVDVDDRSLVGFRDVGTVGSGPRYDGTRRESDLIVDNQMNRSAGSIALEITEFEDLGHEPLARKRCIPVQQDPHAALALPIRQQVLLGSNLADYDGVDGLEMRRVGGQREMHALPLDFAVTRRTQVVLDVSRASDLVGLG